MSKSISKQLVRILTQLVGLTLLAFCVALPVSAQTLEPPPTPNLVMGSGIGLFTDVAVDNAGNIYGAELGQGRIYKFDNSGTLLTSWALAAIHPFNLKIDMDCQDEVYAAGPNLIQRFDSIAEIAYQVGFSSHAHFSTAFQKQFGCSPREFKRVECGDE